MIYDELAREMRRDEFGDSQYIVRWVDENLTSEQIDHYLSEIIELGIEGTDLYTMIYFRHEASSSTSKRPAIVVPRESHEKLVENQLYT